MREIVIDTETTGLDPLDDHRVVEIGTVELINRSPTGKTFHRYLCPQADIPADAVAVHGLTAEFLADKPLFADIADEFLASVVDAPLVAHNANVRLEVVGMPKCWSYEEQELSMKSTMLMSLTAVALIGGSGLAFAQARPSGPGGAVGMGKMTCTDDDIARVESETTKLADAAKIEMAMNELKLAREMMAQKRTDDCARHVNNGWDMTQLGH